MAPAQLTLPESTVEAYRSALAALPPAIRKQLPRDLADTLRLIVPCNDGVGYKLPFAGGVIVVHPGFGVSAIWGPAFNRWAELGGEQGILGYPVRNGSDTTGVFERGRIFDGTRVLYGPLYSRWLQLPVPRPRPAGDTQTIVDGKLLGIELEEQTSLVWQSDRPAAFWVSQRIHQKWLALGGLNSRLGAPQGDWFTLDEKRKVTAQNFAFGIIIAYGDIAYALYASIHACWMSLGGMSSKWGLPVTDVGTVTGIDFADFEGGVIFCRPGASAFALSDISFRINRLKLGGDEDDEGGTARDLYAQISLTGSRVAKITNPNPSSFSARLPKDGDFGTDEHAFGKNDAKIDLRNIRHDAWIEYRIEGWDNDVLSGDDYQGTVSGRITLADLFWQEADGVKTKTDGSLIAELQVDLGPSADVDPYFRHNHWWPFGNFSKSTLSYEIYAETFSDITNSDNWLFDPLDEAYYNLVYQRVAADGHCFGMALEALDTLRGQGLFQPRAYAHPLNANESGGLRRQLHRKHGYQLGAPCVEWFLDLFTDGKTHNPRWNFDRMQHRHSEGEGCLLCLTPEYFSTAGHAVLPYLFTVSKTQPPLRRIFVADPNVPWDSLRQVKGEGEDPSTSTDDKISVQVLETDDAGDQGKFVYGNGFTSYWGEGWTGGRLYHIPHSLLASQPATASSMLVTPAGAVATAMLVILGGDASVRQAADEAGRQFYKTDRPRRWDDIAPNPEARPAGLARIPLMSSGAAGEIYAVGQRGKYDWFRRRVLQPAEPVPQRLTWTVGTAKDGGGYSLAVGGGVCRHRIEIKGGSKDEQDEVETGGIPTKNIAVKIRPKQGRREAKVRSAIGLAETGGVHSFVVAGLSAATGQPLAIAADVPRRMITVTGPLAGSSLSVTLNVAAEEGNLRRAGQVVVPARCSVLELRRSTEFADRLEAVVRESASGPVVNKLQL